VWTYRPLTDGSRPVSPAALAEFQRAQRIRDVFFRNGGKTPAIRLELRVSELEPTLKEIVFDLDGQLQKLTTGSPSITLTAPSARVASVLKVSTGLGKAAAEFTEQGPWAMFRMFDNFRIEPGGVPEKFSVLLPFDGKRVRLEVVATSVFNPFQLRELKQFRCPAAL